MNEPDRFWCRQRIEVTIAGSDGRRTAVVHKPFARVGSIEGSEICLDFAGAAARSLYLHATDQGIYCLPLSYRGTACHGWFGLNQAVPFGDWTVSARIVAETPAADAPKGLLDAKGSAEPPLPILSVRHQGQEAFRYRVTRELTIVGRRPRSHLRIKYPQMSNYHCVLYFHRGLLWVIDLLSTNKTFLDGQPIETAVLPLDGSISLGHSVELAFVALQPLAETHGDHGSNYIFRDDDTEPQAGFRDVETAIQAHEQPETSQPAMASGEPDISAVSPLVAFAKKKRALFGRRLRRALIFALWGLALGLLVVFFCLAGIEKHLQHLGRLFFH